MLDAFIMRWAALFGLLLMLLFAAAETAFVPTLFGALGLVLIVLSLHFVSDTTDDANERELRFVLGFSLVGFILPALQLDFLDFLLGALVVIVVVPIAYSFRGMATIKRVIAVFLLCAGGALYGQHPEGLAVSFLCFALAFLALFDGFQRSFWNLFMQAGLMLSIWGAIVAFIWGPL